MTVSLSDREKELLNLLAEDSGASVNDISERLKVSKVTIRHDLNNLADKGFVVRTRGGAFPAFHPSIMDRQKERTDEKNRIAKTAAGLVNDGDSVMIEAGTTTAFIAKYLYGKRDIHLVTNSTLIIPYARTNPGIHLTLIGGEFKPATESLVGPVALRELEQFHVKIAFAGTDGFTIQTGLTTHLPEGAEIVKAMSKQAEETVLVADSSKCGRAGFVKVLPLSEVSTVITDTGLDPEVESFLREQELRIIKV
jgi:DeoR family transcriptional regulator, galactitol utilization operon repressor